MSTLTISDRGTLVSLEDDNAMYFLEDSFDWIRDLAAKGAREGAETLDEFAKGFAALELDPVNGGLADYLEKQDSWLANLFADILRLISSINPLTMGKQIAVWYLEDFRDLFAALATLVDTEDDTNEETQQAVAELALAVAAMVIPYIGRAGKIIYRVYARTDDMVDGLAMLRHVSPGNSLDYLSNLNLPQYAGKISEMIRKVLNKMGEYLGDWFSSIKRTLTEWGQKLANWITRALKRVQDFLVKAVAAVQDKVYQAATNINNSKIVDKLPDFLLDWVANQINGNLCESCVDNFLVNYADYDRIYPKPGQDKRDNSSFFSPDQGIDGVYEKPASRLSVPVVYPKTYSGLPLSAGMVFDELGIEIEGEVVPKMITRAVEPFGDIPAEFSPTSHRPPTYPRFVVMEAKFGYQTNKDKPLTDYQFKKKLKKTQSGRQMSKKWIEQRLVDAFPNQEDGTDNPKHIEIDIEGYARWLYGCQPHKSKNGKYARPRAGKRRMKGAAYFPPYALRGFDIDGMPTWKV
ncbi:hypothetical protein [Thiosocius teredinicola]|uniref:hypothetical protein n=1 Tax=Thiosocius teredinicola TaxID=1973002 RepID=UPI000990E041